MPLISPLYLPTSPLYLPCISPHQVQLKFLAPNEGTVNYEVHAICSSYLGADKKVLMKKTIGKKPEEEKKTAAEIAEVNP